jgi:benzil reductase ((S)-benzoin forming)
MKAIILTGTSNGLGKSFFDRLSKEDASLFCIARRFLPYQEELAQAAGSRIHLRRADLSRTDELPTTEEFQRFLGGRDFRKVILVHNAAVIEPIGAVGQLDPRKINEALQVNLAAPILLTNALLAADAVASLPVKILFISSGAAKRPRDGWSVYCATKAGGEMFFHVLAEQFQDNDRVSVHNVDPGIMDTSMQETIRSATHVHFPQLERFVQFKEQGMLASPDDVAAAIINEYMFAGQK